VETSYSHPEGPVLNTHNVPPVLRNHWKRILMILGLTVVLVLGWSLMQPRIYQSTVTGLVVTTGSTDVTSSYAGDNLAKSKAVSYGMLATSQPIVDEVITELRLDTSVRELTSDVTVTTPEDSTEVRILVGADSPERAAAIADVWLRTLSEQVREIEGLADSGDVTVNLVPLGNAVVPQEPVSPNVPLNLALAAVAGLLLGLLYAFVSNKMDRRIRSADEIRNDFAVPVLGVLPADERLTDQRNVIATGLAGLHEKALYPEAMRELRTKLSFISKDAPPRVIVVTGALPNDGASSLTANLAVAIASTGRDVVVVDGNLRGPVQTDIFGLAPDMGLTDVLLGTGNLHEVLQTPDVYPHLRVLGAGKKVPNQAELLSSQAMSKLLTVLAEDALVLIDAPPILSVTDAALLAASADGVIVVAATERTTRDHLAESLDTLGHVHGTVLGVVLNDVPAPGKENPMAPRGLQNHVTEADRAETDIEPQRMAGWR
jgi:capsular exopolysaccharide synthesis family protein